MGLDAALLGEHPCMQMREKERTYKVHAEVVPNAVVPAVAAGLLWLVGVLEEPLVELLKSHAAIGLGLESLPDELGIGLVGLALFVQLCVTFNIAAAAVGRGSRGLGFLTRDRRRWARTHARVVFCLELVLEGSRGRNKGSAGRGHWGR